jgi:TPR repeat protein
LLHAEEQVVFSNVSAGIFRFQLKLAEQGNKEAQYIVGEMYEQGSGVAKNKAKALHWFETSASQGHKKSGYKLLYLEIQSNGLNDFSKSQLGVLRKEAVSGDANAQYYLGKMYAAGVGVPKSLTNALTWLNKATFSGLSEAEHEAITVEDELVRIREDQAKKRQASIVAAKKRKAEEDRLRAVKQKNKAKKRQAESARRQSTKNAEAKKVASQRKQMQDERRLLAEEKHRLEKERQIIDAEIARNAKQANQSEKPPEASYVSDPCKGKSARFLSTCR